LDAISRWGGTLDHTVATYDYAKSVNQTELNYHCVRPAVEMQKGRRSSTAV